MSITSREAAEALIREQLVEEIVQNPIEESVFMKLARRLPNMTSKQTKIPVLDMLPMAYFVSGDTGFKQTSRAAWDNVYITAAELAVIIPIPEAVIDDAHYDIVGQVIPRAKEAVGMRVDAAVIFDKGRPFEWRPGITTAARLAGNNIAPGQKDMYDLLLATGGVFAKVEEDGYAVNGSIAATTLKAKLRGLRSTTGVPIFAPTIQDATSYTLDGSPIYFPVNGSFDTDIAQLVAGDFSQAVYAIRQDITVKILDQSVIQDPATGAIVYNLAQQDMIALRIVFRMGWALPNPATRLDEHRISCPFAYLEPASPLTTKTVTVTVTDNAETPVAIPGAYVEFDGVRMMTNASGQVVAKLTAGTYGLVVKAEGYKTHTDSVTVASSNVTKAVKMISEA